MRIPIYIIITNTRTHSNAFFCCFYFLFLIYFLHFYILFVFCSPYCCACIYYIMCIIISLTSCRIPLLVLVHFNTIPEYPFILLSTVVSLWQRFCRANRYAAQITTPTRPVIVQRRSARRTSGRKQIFHGKKLHNARDIIVLQYNQLYCRVHV